MVNLCFLQAGLIVIYFDFSMAIVRAVGIIAVLKAIIQPYKQDKAVISDVFCVNLTKYFRLTKLWYSII
ncbi:MAG: hypothetical protein KAS69_03010 [Planctomycetes bacterium]|nr:hypothetical protein [Planctomycetota bacterium]